MLVVVVDARSVVVVVGSSVVVVVGSTVVVGATVVVVGSTVLTGAGWGSVVGASDGGGTVELGGRVAGAAGAVVVQAASGAGATPGGRSGGAAREVDDASARVLDAAGDGAGPVAGTAVVSLGRAPTTVEAGGAMGTRAAEATTAAPIAKVSPNATSIRR
jgi:hypothetical protein